MVHVVLPAMPSCDGSDICNGMVVLLLLVGKGQDIQPSLPIVMLQISNKVLRLLVYSILKIMMQLHWF